MRVLATGLLVLAVVSCDREPTNPAVTPAGLGIQATYTVAWCYVGSGAGAPPCLTYSTPSGQRRLDSARAVFSRNGTVTWKAAYWNRSCIFPNGTCQETITTSVENATGTYVIGATGVTLSLSEPGRNPWTMQLFDSIPTGVPSSWTGPDSLRFSGLQANFGVVLAQAK